MPKKYLLAHETGTGKTITAIKWAEYLCKKTLILCPKSLLDNWCNELEKYSPIVLYNSFLMSKEQFRRDYDVIMKYDVIIVDECHYFLHQKSQMSRSLLKYIKKHNPENILLLSATPHNGRDHWMVYTLSQIMGKNYSYIKFRSRFFYKINMGGRNIWLPREDSKALNDIQELIRANGDVVKLSDCVDVPDSIFEVEFFELTKEQKKKIEDIKVQEPLQIVKWTKCFQVCNSTLRGDCYVQNEFFKSEKIDRVLDIINEHKKLLIFFRHNLEIDYVNSLIKDKKVFIIRGGVDNISEICKLANQLDDCVVLINIAKSEGYNLGTFDLSVYFSLSFSLKDYIQSMGRSRRIDNFKNKKVYLHLVVKNSIDENVYENVAINKRDFMVDLYEG